jgi:hypothetical protein
MADKTYPITRDGVQFEVRAANPEDAARKAREIDIASVPKIIARQGSTRVFERPNGQRYVVSPGYSSMDPKAVEQALAGMTAGEISRGSIERGLIEQYPVAARAGEFVRGVPFAGSRLDEALGAIAGPEAATGARALSSAMQSQRPMESLGLNVAGGVAATAPLAVMAPQALTGAAGTVLGTGSRASQIARGATAGATMGGVEGAIYGSGEGVTPQERVSEAQTGAAFGAGLGGLLGGATPVVEAGARNIISLFRRSDIAQIAATFGISPNAARVLKNTFEMGGDMNAAMQRLQQAGAEGMVGDAGPAAQALLDAVASSGPSGSAAVRGPLDERMVRTQENLETGLTGFLGQPAEGPVSAVSDIMQRTQGQRTNLYDQAYRTPIDYAAPQGQQIESIIKQRIEPSVLMQAVNEANAEMADRGLTNQQIMAQIAPDGTVQFVEMPNVRQLDELKKALNQLSRNARNFEGMVPVDTQQSLRYARQARDLRDALVEATGGDTGTYAQAIKVGGDTIQERNAYELGERLLSPRTRIEDVRLELGASPSDAQIEAAKRGLRTRIEQVVGDVKRIPSDPNIDARQAVATLREMGSDNAREKIRRVLGNQADDIFKMLDEASIAAETRAATSANSRTAIRQAAQGDIEQMTAPGAVGQALRGDPINTTRALIQAATGYTEEFTTQQRQRIYQDLAKALTQSRGQDAQIALRALDAAMQGQQLTDAQTDMLAKLVSSALATSMAPSAGRATATQYGQ